MTTPYRHYLQQGGAAAPADDLKPRQDIPTPVRAWLVRRSDDDPGNSEGEPDELLAWWRLFVEFDEPVFEVFGEFEQLLAVARVCGVEEYFVWSPTRGSYVQLDAMNVRPQV